MGHKTIPTFPRKNKGSRDFDARGRRSRVQSKIWIASCHQAVLNFMPYSSKVEKKNRAFLFLKVQAKEVTRKKEIF